MVEYKCNTCNKIFHHKNDFRKHLNRKFPCTKTTPHLHQNTSEKSITSEKLKNSCTEISPDTKKSKHVCEYCNNIFTRKYSLTRHLNGRCKIKKEEDNIIKEMLEEMNKLKEDNKRLNEKINNLQGNTTINNTQNNNNNNQILGNVNLVAFGHEDFSCVSDDTMKKIMNRGFNSLPLFFNNVHYNDKRPQYHNIYSSNIKGKHVITYDGERWKLVDKLETINYIVNKYGDVIERKYAELKDELSEHTIRKLDRFIDQYCEKEVMDRYKEDLTLLMYNNKHKVEDIRKIELI